MISVEVRDPEYKQTPAMTLRDVFAGEAMRAMLHMSANSVLGSPHSRKKLADAAYVMADEMMAARERTI